MDQNRQRAHNQAANNPLSVRPRPRFSILITILTVISLQVGLEENWLGFLVRFEFLIALGNFESIESGLTVPGAAHVMCDSVRI